MSVRTTQRIARELRDRIAEILEVRISDPRLEGVSILEVRPSPDLSFARVFYRTWGDPVQTEAALKKAKPFIRHCLAEGLSLRRVPELDLRLDASAESAARIEGVLKELSQEREQRETDRADDAEGSGDTDSGGKT